MINLMYSGEIAYLQLSPALISHNIYIDRLLNSKILRILEIPHGVDGLIDLFGTSSVLPYA